MKQLPIQIPVNYVRKNLKMHKNLESTCKKNGINNWYK